MAAENPGQAESESNSSFLGDIVSMFLGGDEDADLISKFVDKVVTLPGKIPGFKEFTERLVARNVALMATIASWGAELTVGRPRKFVAEKVRRVSPAQSSSRSRENSRHQQDTEHQESPDDQDDTEEENDGSDTES